MDNQRLMKYNTQLDQRKDSFEMVTARNFHHHKGVFSLFVYPNIRTLRFIPSVLAVSVGVFLVGCGGDQPRTNDDTKKYTDQSSAVFAPEPARTGSVGEMSGGNQATNQSTIGGWSIVISKVEGNTMKNANRKLQVIKDETRLKDAFVDRRSGQLVIAYGDYLDKTDPKAMKDLKRIQSIEVEGTRVFSGAMIAPPTSKSLRGSNPDFDLRTVKERFGKRAVYTLQIGVYGRADYQMPSAEDLVSLRRSAEAAVRELRGQGVMAFYYHAPARSMVTVGVFGERDFDSTTLPPTQSPELSRVRKQFPNNLLNGQGINETVRIQSGKTTRLQSSQLVAIPDK